MYCASDSPFQFILICWCILRFKASSKTNTKMLTPVDSTILKTLFWWERTRCIKQQWVQNIWCPSTIDWADLDIRLTGSVFCHPVSQETDYHGSLLAWEHTSMCRVLWWLPCESIFLRGVHLHLNQNVVSVSVFRKRMAQILARSSWNCRWFGIRMPFVPQHCL